jgi:hypothetical protein
MPELNRLAATIRKRNPRLKCDTLYRISFFSILARASTSSCHTLSPLTPEPSPRIHPAPFATRSGETPEI